MNIRCMSLSHKAQQKWWGTVLKFDEVSDDIDATINEDGTLQLVLLDQSGQVLVSMCVAKNDWKPAQHVPRDRDRL